MKDDLISRKAAIEEMLKCGDYYSGNDEAKRGVAQCIGVIHELPAAEPEKHTEERAETHARDCISRQAAIDVLKIAYWDNDIQSAKDDPCIVDAMTDWAIRQVKALPSVEPTLYGYKIEHLAYIARVMEKEGITAEDAARTFDDLVRAVSWAIDEALQKLEEALRT